MELTVNGSCNEPSPRRLVQVGSALLPGNPPVRDLPPARTATGQTFVHIAFWQFGRRPGRLRVLAMVFEPITACEETSCCSR
jgi:hypothetical protein